MKIDLEICSNCLKKHFYKREGGMSFMGYSMYFDGETAHFFAVFKADIRNYGKVNNCEIVVEGGDELARRIGKDHKFRSSFKMDVPKEFNEEIESKGMLTKCCLYYDTYLVKTLNE